MKAQDSNTEPEVSSQSRVLPLQNKGLFYQHVDHKLTIVYKCMPHIAKFQHSLPQYRHLLSVFRSNLLSHLVPTAQCLSNSSNSETDVQSFKEDENVLPGYRIKSERKAVQVSSQKVEKMDAEINMWLRRETDIERLKRSYAISLRGFPAKSIFVHEDTQTLAKGVYYGVIAGCLMEVWTIASSDKGLGGAREKHVSTSHALVKSGQMSKMPKIDFKGISKHLAYYSILLSSVTHLPNMIAVYRNETTMWELAGGAFIAWGMISYKQEGTKHLLKKTAGGVIFGVLYALNVMFACKTQPERNFNGIKKAILEKRLSQKDENL